MSSIPVSHATLASAEAETIRSNVPSRVLVVCAANVCRSPLIANVLTTEAASFDVKLRVTSAGTDVNRASQMCSIGLELVSDDAEALRRASKHTAQQVTRGMVADHELILTAARLERSAIAKLDPAARARTFTVKEAVLLGGASTTPTERAQMTAASASGRDVLSAYAELLNGRRGRVLIPEESRRLPWSHPENPLDVRDVHASRSRHHRSDLRALRALTKQFADQLRAFESAY